MAIVTNGRYSKISAIRWIRAQIDRDPSKKRSQVAGPGLLGFEIRLKKFHGRPGGFPAGPFRQFTASFWNSLFRFRKAIRNMPFRSDT
jgi:hypothetical protein